MAIANETILNKMLDELKQAKQEQNQQTSMLKHIANIHLLCDLFLTEDNPQQPISQGTKTEISTAELKAMMGQEKPQQSQQTFKKSIELDDEGANGKSIFDF